MKAALLLAAASLPAAAETPAKPMFRDPVWDGAADASVVHDRARGAWRMFYTARRATLSGEQDRGVAWVHGTAIGTAVSRDGRHWSYAGTAAIPAACTGATLWAPEVGWYEGRWHMWLTVVPGVFADWNAPRFIVHLTSPDLQRWTCGERLDLDSDRVIDAGVARVGPGRYRLWWNDERAGKAIRQADGTDLKRWGPARTVLAEPGEGPKGFRWRNRWWLVSDAWKGLRVARSDDGLAWRVQPGFLLPDAGSARTDRAKGQHPDVVLANGRAFLVYFVHQGGEPEAARDPRWARRSVLQIAELVERDGLLTVRRDPAAVLPPP